MKKRKPSRDEGHEERKASRIAELLRWTATAPSTQTPEPPPGLEARMLQFIDGAAHTHAERRQAPWRWIFALVGTAAATAALTTWIVSPATPEATISPSALAREVGARPSAQAEPTATPPTAIAKSTRDTRPTQLGSPAERHTPIVAALRSGQDWRSRQAAAEALSANANLDSKGVEALSASLKGDPDWRVREVALSALTARPSEETTRALAVATEDPHLPLRLAATKALVGRLQPASMAARDATDALLRRLERDPDWRVRDSALNLLLASPVSARAAALALTDGHSRLRSQARVALARTTR